MSQKSKKLSKLVKVGLKAKVITGSFKGKAGIIIKVIKENGTPVQVMLDVVKTKFDIVKGENNTKKFADKNIPIDISNISLIG